MRMYAWSGAALLLVGSVPGFLPAGEPEGRRDLDVLPAPTTFVDGPVVMPFPPSRPRPGTREVWQYFGVDRTGSFRPRVILAPAGAYYYANGQPFPWVSNNSRSFMPYATE